MHPWKFLKMYWNRVDYRLLQIRLCSSFRPLESLKDPPCRQSESCRSWYDRLIPLVHQSNWNSWFDVVCDVHQPSLDRVLQSHLHPLQPFLLTCWWYGSDIVVCLIWEANSVSDRTPLEQSRSNPNACGPKEAHPQQRALQNVARLTALGVVSHSLP